MPEGNILVLVANAAKIFEDNKDDDLEMKQKLLPIVQVFETFKCILRGVSGLDRTPAVLEWFILSCKEKFTFTHKKVLLWD